MTDIENKSQLITDVAEPQRTSLGELEEGRRLDPSADLNTRMAMSKHLKEVAAADPNEKSMDVNYKGIYELADEDEAKAGVISREE